MNTRAETRDTRNEPLCERVDEAIRSHKGVLMSWMGPHAAVGELVRREEGLEEALQEIALEVQELAASQKGGTTPLAEHVDAIRSHKNPLLSTTGPQIAVGELVRRNLELEDAVREIALEAQKLGASREP